MGRPCPPPRPSTCCKVRENAFCFWGAFSPLSLRSCTDNPPLAHGTNTPNTTPLTSILPLSSRRQLEGLRRPGGHAPRGERRLRLRAHQPPRGRPHVADGCVILREFAFSCSFPGVVDAQFHVLSGSVMGSTSFFTNPPQRHVTHHHSSPLICPLHPIYSTAASPDSRHSDRSRDPSLGPSEHKEELRCVIAIIRHGDRTPKQKMKMLVGGGMRLCACLWDGWWPLCCMHQPPTTFSTFAQHSPHDIFTSKPLIDGVPGLPGLLRRALGGQPPQGREDQEQAPAAAVPGPHQGLHPAGTFHVYVACYVYDLCDVGCDTPLAVCTCMYVCVCGLGRARGSTYIQQAR